MIDKTNFSIIKQPIYSVNEHINKAPSCADESQDSFIKSKYKNKLIKSDEKMIEMLSTNSFKYLALGLIEKECFYNGADTIKLHLDCAEPYVTVSIANFDIEDTEQYRYTPDEFIDMVQKIKEKVAQHAKESTNDYEKLCSNLVEKLQAYSKNKQ